MADRPQRRRDQPTLKNETPRRIAPRGCSTGAEDFLSVGETPWRRKSLPGQTSRNGCPKNALAALAGNPAKKMDKKRAQPGRGAQTTNSHFPAGLKSPLPDIFLD